MNLFFYVLDSNHLYVLYQYYFLSKLTLYILSVVFHKTIFNFSKIQTTFGNYDLGLFFNPSPSRRWLTLFIFLQRCYSFGFLHLDPWSILIQVLWKMWSLAMFLFLYMDIWFSSTIWKVDFHSPLDCFLILCQRSISWPHLYGSIFRFPFLYSWICIYFFANTVLYWLLWLHVKLRNSGECAFLSSNSEDHNGVHTLC